MQPPFCWATYSWKSLHTTLNTAISAFKKYHFHSQERSQPESTRTTVLQYFWGRQLFTSAQPPRLQWKLFFPLEIISFYLTSAWQREHPSLLRLPIKATKCYESKKDLFLEFSFHILGKKTHQNQPCIGLWTGTPRTPGQFLTLSDDYWAKVQLYISNCCHKAMSNNNAQTSKSARFFNHKIFIKALKCLSSSLSFPITHRIAIFSSGSITIKCCCSVFWDEIIQ